MEYVFCYLDSGWWLKIDSLEKLTDYYEKTQNRWAEVLNDYIQNADNRHFKHKMTAAVVMLAERNHSNILDAITQMKFEIASGQIDHIETYGHIFINELGGYHSGSTYTQWERRKELVFPSYTKDNIKVEKYLYGSHWYAYLGDMQLHDGDKTKWNSYDAAYEFALKYVNRAEEK